MLVAYQHKVVPGDGPHVGVRVSRQRDQRDADVVPVHHLQHSAGDVYRCEFPVHEEGLSARAG